ncbi:hypothetical protein ANO11243_076070 [Dothideomycetidae sp. 11243]|nr:hypothetical protein ANO11243_076070 [fungal sp. No.11243]
MWSPFLCVGSSLLAFQRCGYAAPTGTPKHGHATQQMYHMRIGGASTNSGALAGTVVGGHLESTTTAQEEPKFYLSGFDLVYEASSGPMYAHLAGTVVKSDNSYQTRNILFSPKKSARGLQCSLSNTSGALTCYVSFGDYQYYSPFGILSNSSNDVVMYGGKLGYQELPASTSLYLV